METRKRLDSENLIKICCKHNFYQITNTVIFWMIMDILTVCLCVPEIGAAGRQDHTMSINFLGTHHQHHITELAVFSQQIDHLQGLPWVFVWYIGHSCWLGDPFRELVGVPQSTAAGDVHSCGVLACVGGPKYQPNEQMAWTWNHFFTGLTAVINLHFRSTSSN